MKFPLLSLLLVLITGFYIVFLFLLCVHGYHTLLHWRAISMIPDHETELAEATPISIIICAHNEETNLKKNLESIISQNYSNFEIIIGLDRCSDGSHDFLKSMDKANNLHVFSFDQIPPDWHSKKYVLNQCIEAASNDWLLLTDADCYPASPLWIHSFARLMTGQTNVVLGISPYESQKGTISLLTEYETCMTAISYIAQASLGHPYMGVGRNIAYTRTLFNQVNGFEGIQHITGGDDDLLVQKMIDHAQTQVNIQKESLTYSAPERKWKMYRTQKIRHLSVGKYYRKIFQRNLSIRSAVHSCLWLSFLYLIGFSGSTWRIIVPFALLVCLKGLFFKKITIKLNMPLRMYWYPMMDLLLAIFLPLIAIRAVLERNIRWKK